MDAAKALDKIDDATDIAKAADKLDDAADAAKALDKAKVLRQEIPVKNTKLVPGTLEHKTTRSRNRGAQPISTRINNF